MPTRRLSDQRGSTTNGTGLCADQTVTRSSHPADLNAGHDLEQLTRQKTFWPFRWMDLPSRQQNGRPGCVLMGDLVLVAVLIPSQPPVLFCH